MTMKAVKTFTLGLLRGPRWVLLWVVVGLMGANLFVPAFFMDLLEAKVVVATFACGGALMMILTDRYGYTRILGLGHIFWLALVPYLLTRWSIHPADTSVGIWLRAATVINIISLILDAADVLRYLRG
jgi:hypothetical protein